MQTPPRAAGVLLHPGSLPSGRLDREAYRFVDFLAAAGLSAWQALPLGVPDAFGSPYAAASAFAGNPALLARPHAPVRRSELDAFAECNAYWLPGWERYAGAGAAADHVRFEREWLALRSYANARGITLLGDVPIYVAADSADTRDHPAFFLDGLQAGAAPDRRHPSGQLWGNPLYDWDAIERMRRTLHLYDGARIDHFRGFAAAWAIPAGETDAARGCFLPGPGAAPFHACEAALGALPLYVEDLGLITDDVVALRDELHRLHALGAVMLDADDSCIVLAWPDDVRYIAAL